MKATWLAGLFLIISSNVVQADLYYGLARYNQLTGFTAEYAANFGSIYGILGSVQTDGGFHEDDLTTVLGYRNYIDKPYTESSFFVGVLAGDLDPASSGPRNGVGGELGYQFMKQYWRFVVYGSLVALEEIKAGDGRIPEDAKPAFIMGASIGLKR